MNQYRGINKTNNLLSWNRVFIFVFPCVLFVFIWLLFYNVFQSNDPKTTSSSLLRGFDSKNNFYHSDLSSIDHAIIVAGHAVLRVNYLKYASINDNGWYLLPYQINRGFPEIIRSHIQKGIELTSEDRNSLLLFSGGQTRKDVGPLSEGLSYYLVAKYYEWFSKDLLPFVYVEEFAKDSYENLLFSLCRFKEITSHYPSKVTVVGFDFKSYRFTELHRKAIHFPKENFTYVGLHPRHQKFDHNQAKLGEHIAVQEFIKDMYGCRDENLIVKKKKRNPFYRTTPYELACPELKPLLRWCDSVVFDSPETLPWSKK